MNKSKRCFIMGLPNAGKTTYLAALWYSLNSALTKNKIKLNSMGNDKYLSGLSKKWLNAEQLDRTKLGYEKTDILIEIVDENNDIFNLRFPDLSGETFQNLYEKREINSELVEYIISADGILMFINVADIREATFITDVSDNLPSSQNNNDINEENYRTRNPKQDDPTQVQVIELLQFVEIIRKNQCTNLDIILSAWDLSRNLEVTLTPEEYVKKYMNMLWQFIQSNSSIFKTYFWGVSAQGGKLDDEEELLSITEPMDRILVVNNKSETCHDITLPIYKIVGGLNNE